MNAIVKPTGGTPGATEAAIDGSLSENDIADRFGEMLSSGALDTANDEERPDTGNAQPEGGEVEETDGEEGAGDTTGADDNAGGEKATDGKQAKGDEEAVAYNSFDEMLEGLGVDPQSARTLPIKLNVDGLEREVPLKEIIDGYNLSQASFDRMQRLATERQAFDTEQQQVRNALGIRIQQTEQLLGLAQNHALGELAQLRGPLGQQLNQENPQEFARLWNLHTQRTAEIQQSLQQIAQARNDDALQQQQQQKQAIDAGKARLLELRPEWRDPAKARTAQVQMYEFGKKMGFSDAEMGNILDHRYMLVLDMAARYAQLQAKSPAKLKQVRMAPRVAKPGARVQRDPRQDQYRQRMDRWNKTGRQSDDEAAALFQMLSDADT